MDRTGREGPSEEQQRALDAFLLESAGLVAERARQLAFGDPDLDIA